MARQLVTMLSAASLALCVMSAGLWVRSYYKADALAYYAYVGPSATVVSYSGSIVYSYYYPHPRPPSWPQYAGYRLVPAQRRGWTYGAGELSSSLPFWDDIVRDPGVTLDWRVLGFRWKSSEGTPPPPRAPFGLYFVSTTTIPFAPYRRLGVPYWFVVAAFGGWPAWRIGSGVLRRRRRARRLASGLCSACGYDLRATAGRCPECGAERARPGANGSGHKATRSN